VAELRFRVGAIFPADNPTARYVMAVSIALGDIRTVTEFAARDGQPRHERLYFIRLLEHHVREGLRLALVAYRDRDDVRRFVAILPEEAQDAREGLDRLLDGPATEGLEPFADLDRSREAGVLNAASEDRDGPLRAAMERVAAVESGFRIDGLRRRADFADLVVATTMLPAGVNPEDPDLAARVGEASSRVLPPLVTYLEHAEAAWLRPWRG
jgi:hypothetical protein